MTTNPLTNTKVQFVIEEWDYILQKWQTYTICDAENARMADGLYESLTEQNSRKVRMLKQEVTQTIVKDFVPGQILSTEWVDNE